MLSNSGVNKVILLGIAEGPFEQKTVGGLSFLCFSIITAEQLKKGTNYVEHSEYHRVRIPEKLITPEVTALANGITLFIEGKISTTTVIDEQRIKRYNLDIVAHKIDVLGKVDVSAIKS
ncbi:single-stranded DNA-binding protein [Mucilaginibacter psychrotolerans]|uniref:Single-stranded DNA-binding protein n=1 Tax=Mucilaginibacter psychrotolerans TaxID=1524096 RepID=A0A4Y8S6Q2_9SPHI|nr:single-stranded DNA-binding protein [Mucilaginibacter psychrotolerans]TFF34426.1 hypothetical protein E2R66_22395 [Mucilaginibacter psychrotolerans]